MRIMTEEQTCGTCIFCERITCNMGQGKCRNGPPTAAALPVKGPLGAMGIQQIAFYPPVTLADRGCGEYIATLHIEGNNGED